MTNREYQKQKRRVYRLVRHWKPILGLQLWKIDNAYYDGQPPEDPDEDRGEFIADCHVEWEYLFARIRWDLTLVAKMSDEELERTVIHELFHVVVNEMRHIACDDGIYHEERVVTTLTIVADWLMQEGAERYKKGLKT